MTNFNYPEQLNIIKSFSQIKPEKFIKSIIETCSEEDLLKFMNLIKDEDLGHDLEIILKFFYENFKSDNPTEFIYKIANNLENHIANFPPLKDKEKILEFVIFINKIRINVPREKIILKSKIENEFKVKGDTLNKWFHFFGKENFIGRRSFTSLEYAEILKDFTIVGKLDIEDVSKYHFACYDKLTIARIIGNPKMIDKTNYNKALLSKENIDDLDSKNIKILNWVRSHHKMPFSIAYQYISLILKYNNDTAAMKIEDVFKSYEQYL